MPNLIDRSFFVGDITIPNTSKDSVGERLDFFISKFEPKCLEGLMGYRLYKEFLSNPTDQRMVDIKDGKEYTDSYGRLSQWKGLVHDTNLSLIAYFVYYYYQESSATHTTGVSTSTSDTEAGKSVSPRDKMISANHQFSDEARSLLSFLWNNRETYPEFDSCNLQDAKWFSSKVNYFDF